MKRMWIPIVLVMAFAAPLMAGDVHTKDGKYDFFGLARYPEGGKLVDGVELYEVKEGGGPADQYTRRVVRWWPRKGVDFIEIQDGMIEREWTRLPSLIEEAPPGLSTEPTVVEHEGLRIAPLRGKPWYMRRFRGYLHPPEDGNYVFKIAADTMAFFSVSEDEKPENLRIVCGLSSYARPAQWDKHPGQISVPIPMEKGKKYYYEVIHVQTTGGNHVGAAWRGDTMALQTVGGSTVSTLDGRRGIVIEERWDTTSGGGVRPKDLPRTFKAHLIGFDGIGNPVASPESGRDFVVPTVILRLPDGTKRGIKGDKFVQADQEFIMGIYVDEMKRIRSGLVQDEHKAPPGLLKAYPVPAGTGKPGSVHLLTERFAIVSRNQRAGSHLVAQDEKSIRARKAMANMLEHMHAYLEYGGHLMPFWDRKELFKFAAHTGEGAAMGGYGGASASVEDTPGGFTHEYGHGFTIQWRGAHCGESFATAVQEIVGGTHGSCHYNIRNPYRNCMHGSYVATLFYRMIGFDPNWGMTAMTALPQSAGERSFFQTLARLGQQRGLFADGVRGIGDMFGDYAARQAEFDTQIQEGLRHEWVSVARNYLEPVDQDKGIYRIPWAEAPEPYGLNVVRLVPTGDAAEIVVDFQGYHDPAMYSDWRACIVAVDGDGRARYSDLWNKGKMTMPRREGDLRYWLTVAATPRAMLDGGRYTRAFWNGPYAARYPWQATFIGAVPGRPQRSRTDLHDLYCAYGPMLSSGDLVPAVPNTECGRRYIDEARPVLEELQRLLRQSDSELQKVSLMQTIMAISAALGAADGAPHPNGGGWVAATAEVAPTAYVGPHAAVLDQARVLDHAVIEDYAVLRNHTVVAEHARVGGQAVLQQAISLTGYQRCWLPASGPASHELPELSAPTTDDGLLANYAMEQAETMMLENFYRNEAGPREFFGPLLNGYLYGRPAFVTEGERRGFAFDGKTQYAELDRRVGDLGRITVDMAVKWQGRGAQTLLDFGSDADHRFTLVTAGREGRPEFTAVVAGKETVRVVSSAALPKGAWSRVRVEIDGETAALWIDDKPVGAAESAFRPCDAFKPGGDKRNFIAAARDGSGKFEGVFEYVTIYNEVHGRHFAALPAPILDAPRHPQAGLAERVRRNLGMSQHEQRERAALLSGPMMGYLGRMSSKATARLSELMRRHPAWGEAVENARQFDEWKKDQERQYGEAFDESAEAKALQARIAEIDARIGPVRREIDAVRKARPPAEPTAEPTERVVELLKLIEESGAEIAGLRQRIKRIEQDAEATVAAMPETAAEQEEIARLQERIKPLEAKAKAALQEAIANDPEKEAWDVGRRDLAYSPLYWRVRASQGIGSREDILKAELVATNPDYRLWTRKSARLDELRRQRRYRYETYLLQQTDRAELQARIGILDEDVKALRRDLKTEQDLAVVEPVAASEEVELQQTLAALNEQKGVLTRQLGERRNEFIQQKLQEAGAPEKEKERNAALSRARNEAMAAYAQEDSAIQAMQRSAFHGFYNRRYASAVGPYAASLVGGPSGRFDFGMAASMANLYVPAHWKTNADQWDWRTAWEVKEGSLDELPLTRKWLERVGGMSAD